MDTRCEVCGRLLGPRAGKAYSVCKRCRARHGHESGLVVRSPALSLTPAEIDAVRQAREDTVEAMCAEIGIAVATWYLWRTAGRAWNPTRENLLACERYMRGGEA